MVSLGRITMDENSIDMKGEKVTGFIARLIATGLGSGFAPVASGTVGSAVTVPLAFALAFLGDWPYVIIALALIGPAIWAAGYAEKYYRKKDCGYIVIDEIIGMLIAAAFLPQEWTWLIIAFFVFRFFDIMKVWPASAAEKLPGGTGIVLDDVIAGIYSNIVLQLIRLVI